MADEALLKTLSESIRKANANLSPQEALWEARQRLAAPTKNEDDLFFEAIQDARSEGDTYDVGRILASVPEEVAAKHIDPSVLEAVKSGESASLSAEGPSGTEREQEPERKPFRPELEKSLDGAAQTLSEALRETDGNLGEAIRRSLVTEQEVEQAIRTGRFFVPHEVTGAPRPMSLADMERAVSGEYARIFDEQERSRAQREDAQGLQPPSWTTQAPSGAPEPLPAPYGQTPEPEPSMQTVARLAQYGRTAEASALSMQLQEEYKDRLNPERLDQLITDVVPLAWLRKWDELSPLDRTLYAGGDALLFVGTIGKGATTVGRLAAQGRIVGAGGAAAGRIDPAPLIQIARTKKAMEESLAVAGYALDDARALTGAYERVGQAMGSGNKLAVNNALDELIEVSSRLGLPEVAQRARSLRPVGGGSVGAMYAPEVVVKGLPYRASQMPKIFDDVLRDAQESLNADLRRTAAGRLSERGLLPSGASERARRAKAAVTVGMAQARREKARTAAEAAAAYRASQARVLAETAQVEALLRGAGYATGATVLSPEQQEALAQAEALTTEIESLDEQISRSGLSENPSPYIERLIVEAEDLALQRAKYLEELPEVEVPSPAYSARATVEIAGPVGASAPQISIQEELERDLAPQEGPSIQEELERDLAPLEVPSIQEELERELAPLEVPSIQEQLERELAPLEVPSIQEQMERELAPQEVTSIQEQLERELSGEVAPARRTRVDESLRAEQEESLRLQEETQTRVQEEPAVRPAVDPFIKPFSEPLTPPTAPRLRPTLPRFRPPQAKTPRPSRQPQAPYAEWVGHKQGFMYRYKNLKTGQEVYSLTPLYGKVPQEQGKGSAARSARVVKKGPMPGSKRKDNMGAVVVRYTPQGRISFKRRKA